MEAEIAEILSDTWSLCSWSSCSRPPPRRSPTVTARPVFENLRQTAPEAMEPSTTRGPFQTAIARIRRQAPGFILVSARPRLVRPRFHPRANAAHGQGPLSPEGVRAGRVTPEQNARRCDTNPRAEQLRLVSAESIRMVRRASVAAGIILHEHVVPLLVLPRSDERESEALTASVRHAVEVPVLWLPARWSR